MKGHKPKHCKICNRALRDFNKSGYCSNCYRDSDKVKEYSRNYQKLNRNKKLK